MTHPPPANQTPPPGPTPCPPTTHRPLDPPVLPSQPEQTLPEPAPHQDCGVRQTRQGPRPGHTSPTRAQKSLCRGSGSGNCRLSGRFRVGVGSPPASGVSLLPQWRWGAPVRAAWPWPRNEGKTALAFTRPGKLCVSLPHSFIHHHKQRRVSQGPGPSASLGQTRKCQWQSNRVPSSLPLWTLPCP